MIWGLRQHIVLHAKCLKEQHTYLWPAGTYASVFTPTVYCTAGDHQAWRASAAAISGSAEAVGAPGILIHRFPVPAALHALSASPPHGPGASCLPVSCIQEFPPAFVEAALWMVSNVLSILGRDAGPCRHGDTRIKGVLCIRQQAREMLECALQAVQAHSQSHCGDRVTCGLCRW